ncbi:hypothetical protein FRC11_001332, partial [Ceratobasidium sp. 423]
AQAQAQVGTTESLPETQGQDAAATIASIVALSIPVFMPSTKLVVSMFEPPQQPMPKPATEPKTTVAHTFGTQKLHYQYSHTKAL